MTELGKQVWKKMEEMGWENVPKDFHLEYYENIIECTKQALTIPAVVVSEERAGLCDNPNCEDGIVDRDYYGHPIYCQVCESHN